MRGNHTLIFLSFSFSLPSPLCKNKKILKKRKKTFINSLLSALDKNLIMNRNEISPNQSERNGYLSPTPLGGERGIKAAQ